MTVEVWARGRYLRTHCQSDHGNTNEWHDYDRSSKPASDWVSFLLEIWKTRCFECERGKLPSSLRRFHSPVEALHPVSSPSNLCSFLWRSIWSHRIHSHQRDTKYFLHRSAAKPFDSLHCYNWKMESLRSAKKSEFLEEKYRKPRSTLMALIVDHEREGWELIKDAFNLMCLYSCLCHYITKRRQIECLRYIRLSWEHTIE